MSIESITYTHASQSRSQIFLGAEPQFIHDFESNIDSIFLVDDNFYKLNISLFDRKKIIKISSGESGKSWESFESVLQDLLAWEVGVNVCLVGVGGGVVLDLTGFIASVYKRGVGHAFIPTTLLAMVDAAHGGKNGINMGELKNMVGAIKQPDKIWICPDWLKTLPEREWKQGIAEIIKHALIRDVEMVEWLETKTFNDVSNDSTLWLELIRRNIKLKMELVNADVRDQGARRLLNFGHTVAHAIETTYQLSHGDAVAIGMCMEAKLAVSMALLDGRIPQRIQQLLERYELPFHISIDPERCWQNLLQDKKRSEDSISWIVPSPIGSAVLHRIPLEMLKPHFFKLFQSC
jgi:3-dehydroquinate synthase